MRKTVTKKRMIRKVNHVPGCGVPVGLRGGRGTGAGGFWGGSFASRGGLLGSGAASLPFRVLASEGGGSGARKVGGSLSSLSPLS